MTPGIGSARIYLGERRAGEADDCLDDLSLSGSIRSGSPEMRRSLVFSIIDGRRGQQGAADARATLNHMGVKKHSKKIKRVHAAALHLCK